MADPQAFTGTAAEIGSEVFIQIAMPIVREASPQMEPAQLIQLYSGFVGAAFGALEADFGKGLASAIALKLAQSYADQPPIDESPLQ